jgi:CRP/FNR family transcriptional regulator, anaerobic regulatory protein
MATKTSVRMDPARRRAPIDRAIAPKSGKLAQFRSMCSTCNLRELCLPCCGLNRAEVDIANSTVFSRQRVRRGESLYRTGDPFSAIYAVRNGFFKTTAELENGRDQVIGFYMTGEVLGMDGIGPERHTCNAIALEDSGVCTIPFSSLQVLTREIPSLQQHLHKVMSCAIVHEHGVMLLLGSMNAEERLAVFLLNLSKRFAARGYSASEFNLRLTREEIGSYLGLKLETVSRIFSKFHDEGLIEVRQKIIRILDNAGLVRVMGREFE